MALEKTKRKVNEIILHCSATREGVEFDASDIRKWHRARGWSDIGYHYVVLLDGVIQPGRNINQIGAHTQGHNTGSIGICYIGGVDKTQKAKDTRTPEQREALLNLVHNLLQLYNLPLTAVHCHNEYANKACPSFGVLSFYEEYNNKYNK